MGGLRTTGRVTGRARLKLRDLTVPRREQAGRGAMRPVDTPLADRRVARGLASLEASHWRLACISLSREVVTCSSRGGRRHAAAQHRVPQQFRKRGRQCEEGGMHVPCAQARQRRQGSWKIRRRPTRLEALMATIGQVTGGGWQGPAQSTARAVQGPAASPNRRPPMPALTLAGMRRRPTATQSPPPAACRAHPPRSAAARPAR